MKPCSNCDHHETGRGLTCEYCSPVINVMTVIKKHWNLSELEELQKKLRAGTAYSIHKEAVNRNAPVMAKLLWIIIAEGQSSPISPDTLKSRVCDAITAEIAGQKEIAEFDKKRGDGEWMRQVNKALRSWVGAIATN